MKRLAVVGLAVLTLGTTGCQYVRLGPACHVSTGHAVTCSK